MIIIPKYIFCFEGASSSVSSGTPLTDLVTKIITEEGLRNIEVITIEAGSYHNMKKEFNTRHANIPKWSRNVIGVGKSLGAIRMYRICRNKHFDRFVSIDPTNLPRMFFRRSVKVKNDQRGIVENLYQVSKFPKGNIVQDATNLLVNNTDHMKIISTMPVKESIRRAILMYPPRGSRLIPS